MTTRLTITLCGSIKRAATDLRRVERALALAGHLVHAPCPPLPGEPKPTLRQRANLAARHRAAMRGSDLVIAVRWPGDDSRQEMRDAQGLGVATRWAVTDADIDALIADIHADRLNVRVPA